MLETRRPWQAGTIAASTRGKQSRQPSDRTVWHRTLRASLPEHWRGSTRALEHAAACGAKRRPDGGEKSDASPHCCETHVRAKTESPYPTLTKPNVAVPRRRRSVARQVLGSGGPAEHRFRRERGRVVQENCLKKKPRCLPVPPRRC